MAHAFQELSVALPKQPVEAPSIVSPCNQRTATDDLSLDVATSVRAVEKLKPIWRKWAHNLETDFDYYLDNLRNDSTILRPYVITVYRVGVAEGMLVGQVRKERVSTVVSFVKIPGPVVSVLEIVHGGRMGSQSPAIDGLLALQLCGATQSAEVDLVCLQRLPLQSELFRALQRSTDSLIKERVPHVFRYSVVPLSAPPGKSARALSGKNSREIRRKTRILQRSFPGKTYVRCFSQPADLEAGIRDVASIDISTWQHYLGCGFLDARRRHENLVFCATRGWLRLYVMYVDQSPVAFLIGQHYNQTFYCQHAGYHPDFSRFSVGSLLTAQVLENLAAAGVEQVDLGEGGQEHNRRLGCRLCEEGTVHVYSWTLRGICVNAFFAIAMMTRAAGCRLRSRMRLKWADRLWRQLLTSPWRSQHRSNSPCGAA